LSLKNGSGNLGSVTILKQILLLSFTLAVLIYGKAFKQISGFEKEHFYFSKATTI